MTHRGACGSKNVGTSNRKEGEIPSRRKIKVSWATVFVPGLVGPKEMAKAEFDGQLVNIPALLFYPMVGRSVVYKAHYGFEFVSEGGFLANPETDLNVTSKQSINV